MFTITLRDMSLEADRSPDRSRDVDFVVQQVQIDMRHPFKEVVFASVSQPFLKTHMRRDDIAMLDVHIRDAMFTFGEMEACITQHVWEQVARLQEELAPGTAGLVFDEVLSRAGVPYHLSCAGPPVASPKLVVWSLQVSRAKANVWCMIYLPDAHYIPDTLRVMIAVVSFGAVVLDIKGAELKVPAQQVFSDRRPGEGSPGAVVSQGLRHYLPHLKACWQSLLKDSNVFLGGVVSRHFWAARKRLVCQVQNPVCMAIRNDQLGSGQPSDRAEASQQPQRQASLLSAG